jgi:hypothetical protein
MGDLDIGFARGVMRCGKKWELVAFNRGRATLAKFTFAQKGMAHYEQGDFRSLLAEEGLVEFAKDDDFSGLGKPWKDESGQLMWMVPILVADERGEHSRLIPALSPMSEDSAVDENPTSQAS